MHYSYFFTCSGPRPRIDKDLCLLFKQKKEQESSNKNTMIYVAEPDKMD